MSMHEWGVSKTCAWMPCTGMHEHTVCKVAVRCMRLHVAQVVGRVAARIHEGSALMTRVDH
jgi:hypothetical protein